MKANMTGFKEGDLIIYQNGDRFEIGKIKRITEDGAFVWYSSGETAAKTPFDCMHKLVNGYVIEQESLGAGQDRQPDRHHGSDAPDRSDG